MKENLEEKLLQQFESGMKNIPCFEKEKEKKIFLQLQKYNLIHVNKEGVFIITKKGKEALKFGVEKLLVMERFEERLIKDSFSRGTERKWIFFAIIPLIILLSLFMLFLQIG